MNPYAGWTRKPESWWTHTTDAAPGVITAADFERFRKKLFETGTDPDLR